MTYFYSLFDKFQTKRVLSIPNALIVLLCAIYLLSEAYYIISLVAIHKTDMSLYYRTSSNILQGLVPFRDFKLEYPIFAIFPLFVSATINLLFGASFESFCILFSLQNIIFGLIGGKFLAKIQIPGTDSIKRISVYWMLILFSLPIYLFRYDPFPLVLTAIMIYFMPTRPTLSGVFLMLAIQAKLYPIIFLPILVLFYFFSREYRKLSLFYLGRSRLLW